MKYEYQKLLNELEMGCVGACNCQTKTPDVKYHKTTCHYRLHKESIKAIKDLHRAR